ncbi:inorganic pyrophosphatase TTM2 [Trifolium repens]|nr:inorganic pyrophosphatase TTM2 [Trifolium repens]
MLYGKEIAVTLKEVQSALRTKELTKFKDLKVEDGMDALNVSGGKDGSRGRRARAKGGDKWSCFHCQKKGHIKRDCPELKDKNESVHIVDGSSGDENYETAEALVVSSWESEESESLDSGGSHDVLELWDVEVVSVGVSPRGQYFSALFINNNRHFFIMFVTFKIMKSLE